MATIAIDFDGVIHEYSKGWHDGTCYDKPKEGAFETIRDLLPHHQVFILTTRPVDQVYNWLVKHNAVHFFEFGPVLPSDLKEGPFWNRRYTVGITNCKLAATVYLDDRAKLFAGRPYEWVALRKEYTGV